MVDLLNTVIVFLVFSSLGLAVLGSIAFVLVTLFRVRGAASYWILSLVLLLPVLTPLHHLYPENAKVEFSTDSRMLRGLTALVSLGVPTSPPKAELVESSATLDGSTVTAAEEYEPPPSGWIETFFLIPLFSLALFLMMYWKVLVTAVWLSVVTCLSVRLVRSLCSFRDMLRHSKVVDGPEVYDVLEQCAKDIGLRRVPRLVVTDQAEIPMVAGLFHLLIVVPSRLVEPKNKESLRFAILHEMAHIRRLDHLWLLLETAMRIVYFFHPIVRWVIRRMREEREFLSDMRVVKITANADSYSDFLATEIWDGRTDEWGAFALPFNPGAPTAVRRVQRLIRHAKRRSAGPIRKCLSVTAMTAALLVVLAFAPEREDRWRSLDFASAIATEQPGVYHVPVVFRHVRGVEIHSRNLRWRILEPDEDYMYDEETGRLAVKDELREGSGLIVFGQKRMPWVWRCHENINPTSVQVVIAGQLCMQGEDYIVDQKKHQIRILKEELCQHRRPWSVQYDLTSASGEPIPNSTVTLGFGTSWRMWPSGRMETDRFDGPPRSNHAFVTVLPTDQPNLYRLPIPLREEGMRVRVRRMDRSAQRVRVLERGKDYEYDEREAAITLKGLTLDGGDTVLLVEGERMARGRHHPVFPVAPPPDPSVVGKLPTGT